jgi:hypothetical protein
VRVAVDTNVVLDVLLPDPAFAGRSLAALEKAAQDGGLVICETVAAEIGAQFARVQAYREMMERVSLKLIASDLATTYAAGRAFREYRARGGRRDRLLADFMVGAHALHQADALLTRDRGYYATYFPRLKVLAP